MGNDISKLMSRLAATGYSYDFEKIMKAYEYAKLLHEGQFRKSGEPYIMHPVAVAEIVAGLQLDTDSICAALLHDTLEDCGDKVDIDIIRKKFGSEVAELVDGLTKLVSIPFDDKEEEHIENLRKMFLAMSKDLRVIFIKLCDRLHNMRTLNSHTEAKQRTIALETMHVYAPLAHRLGIQKIKQELEMLAIQYLDPIGTDEVKKDIEKKYGMNKDFLERAQNMLSEKMHEQHIKFGMEGRVKTIYSIYRKMYNQNKSFDEIYDFYAIRILVDTELECYTVLGIIHEMFNSMPGRFKDYISTPKPNMYRSLHTTVIGRDGIPFEVQIRTWEMHRIAEYGIAAHWKYKDGVSDKKNIAEKLAWIRTLIETEKDSAEPDEFLRPFKTDFFGDETFVFTPKGDVISLPSGSCAIDFAYAIHSEIGNKMVGAKVNGMITPIDTVLQNGQIVAVLTSQASKGPNRDWLKVVKTSEAKNKIRQWFKKEKRTENIEVGRNETEKELRRYNVQFTEAQKNEIIVNVSKRQGFNDVDDFYNAIGYGGLLMSKVSKKLRDEFERVVIPPAVVEPFSNIEQKPQSIKTGKSQRVIVDSIDNCQVKFAKCCNPLPGDTIVGFITKGYGISIHKNDCPNVIHGRSDITNADRWISAHWEGKSSDSSEASFEALLNIYAHNSLTLLAEISSVLAEMHIGILSINSRAKEETDSVNIAIVVRTKNTEHFNSIVSRLKKLDDIIEVSRGYM
ncbi:MAG: bifunctional (p)ppGpp synthetase/guanosine-3',5'-bis(diphosphate) 3'-pyrophosphohydrolase [Clostridia bacterium]|nr:bifunctional (p)ppGpp synthetase/guanosine-3',5'-bis(diphosphate) 3'-pyrophosphohydrolase [Clostridia bacterium]